MCGIFGLIGLQEPGSSKSWTGTVKKLAIDSQTRGKDSSGLCLVSKETEEVYVAKTDSSVKELLSHAKVMRLLRSHTNDRSKSVLAFGHARLVTNGSQLNHENNQPICKDGYVVIHNGIIVNTEQIWKEFPDLDQNLEIDTEVIPALVSRFNRTEGLSLEASLLKAVSYCRGTVSLAMLSQHSGELILYTNNGSLYTLVNKKNGSTFFASEIYPLQKAQKSLGKDSWDIVHIEPGSGIVYSHGTSEIRQFSSDRYEPKDSSTPLNWKLKYESIPANNTQSSLVLDLNELHLLKGASREQGLLVYPLEKIEKLKRCTKCILPETFPFISFDDQGVCNYCNNHKKKEKPQNVDELINFLEPYRRSKGYEAVVPFSGGRDSSYSVHLLKKELGLNIVTYTYDWGMVTDLARRNIARMCGDLGVENIIVAADVKWKRNNIKSNLTAWLKNPQLGMIPLFMAGDKFFFYYAYKVRRQLGLDLEIFGVNDLENTNFKTGFAGISPEWDKERVYSISFKRRLELFGYVGKNLVQNPGYINQSMLDSLGSFFARYWTPKSAYIDLYDYYKWDEDQVNSVLLNEYDWETSIDTNSTWRIGDGTASFYNYVYTLVAGFSENDTFRSNQIREGMITRERALELVREENKPRYNSLKWYLEIVGLDFEETVKVLNNIPRKY